MDERLATKARVALVEMVERTDCSLDDDVADLVKLIEEERALARKDAIGEAASLCDHHAHIANAGEGGHIWYRAAELIRQKLGGPSVDARTGIARYFRHIERMEVGSIFSKASREIVGFCAAWIENRLDEKWQEEIDAQREAERKARASG
jgi:hypothetical protein